ncbi:DUF4494 domain-containing protein [Porphyromonas circumdentaria]|uniref:Uncharacterized protein n=1 Tax=Porphyromonas circumdentaria TaxID=29524 RepID=A0A1T4KQ50_9PORP|nr:DUF4494 domain-containing protein [Porphyromonas circumdentaria]MBB6274950.1 hypothetical protein [Porphyromonas circumdentaria]MDO4722218.1 DUF4494 domain-containing protein [Porphyromonas circumdentaria]SJZ44531.1 protein of unknown function [Porphyromonas circumdentaria]
MNNWYECKVRYERLADTGLSKKSSESYLVDAYSVTEAEARIIEEVTPFASTGEVMISSIKREKFAELFLSTEDEDDKFYRCKVLFISLDEKNGVEKKTPVTMIVKASSLLKAVNRLDKEMSTSMTDYSIASVVETNIMDVFSLDLSK